MKAHHAGGNTQLSIQSILSILMLLISISAFSVSTNPEATAGKPDKSSAANVQVSFSVDMTTMLSIKKFNAATDKVYLRGSFNSWGLTHEMTAGTDNVYRITVSLPANSGVSYKYYITSAGADNSGWENDHPVTYDHNRYITIGSNHLNLATVTYNDADMNLSKSSAHFDVLANDQDAGDIDRFVNRLEWFYQYITTALKVSPTEKTRVYLYRNLDMLHMAQGYPENSEGSVGSAYGTNKLVMLSPFKMGVNDALGLVAHEFTHCMNATKTKIQMPAWLNEGVASYFGRNFSTKDWIKSVMDSYGKPNIENVFLTDMGYAYSSIMAYFIIQNKGMDAMAKFVENMNYADIGYNNLAALQSEWHNFLDIYLNSQANIQVTFRVDMTDMIAAGFFHPATDQVFIKGEWNSMSNQPMTPESGNIYAITLSMNRYWFYSYRFYTNSATAPNNGLETDTNESIDGYHLLNARNTDLNLNAVKFASVAPPAVTGVDMAKIANKITSLSHKGRIWNTPSFATLNTSIRLLTPAQYQLQKPSDALPFDAGYVSDNDTIYISEPTTPEQKAVFPDLTKTALYYLSQAYIFHYYQTHQMPLLFKVGFPVFESGILPADNVIKTAISAYGGSFSTFDTFNDRNLFISNKGWAVAGAFAEMMEVFKNWGWGQVINVTSTGFEAPSWWYNVFSMQGLLDDFNRYTNSRFMLADNNMRVQVMKETDHLRIYTRPYEAAINFPILCDSVEAAFQEYISHYGIQPAEKLNYFTLSDCADADIEGVSCDASLGILGGTAWSSGLHLGCVSNATRLNDAIHLARHELAHAFQGNMPTFKNSQWLGEGFAFFSDGRPLNSDYSNSGWGFDYWRQLGIASLERAVKFFGHRPTYAETNIYPGYETDYGYKYLGYFLCDYIYRKGGYQAVKEVQLDDLRAYQQMGYASGQDFLDDFYFDFDVRVQKMPVAQLLNPVADKEENGNTVLISWQPLKNNVKWNVSVSTDDKKTWTKLADHLNASSYTWNAGNLIARFYIQLSAPDNLNLTTVVGPFVKGDLTQLNIINPTAGNYVVAGDTLDLQWGTTSIQNIKLEYSLNGSTARTTITTGIPANQGHYKWLVPASFNGTAVLRITDTGNAATFDDSETINIVPSNEAGGPYVYDNHTLLLLHLDNNLNNRSKKTNDATGNTDNLTVGAATQSLGNSYHASSVLKVPHSVNLNLSGDWTLEAWVRFSSFNTSNNMYLMWKPGDTDNYQSNYSMELNPWWGNIFYVYYFSGYNSRLGVSGFTPMLNEWYHVAFVRNTKTKKLILYVRDKNRQLVSTQETTYSPTETYLNGNDLQLGVNLDGYIDEVRISDVVRTFVKTGLEDPANTTPYSIYPNPSNGYIRIEDETGNCRVEIVDLQGKTVQIQALSPESNRQIDIHQLAKGMYIVRVSNASGIHTAKLMVE